MEIQRSTHVGPRPASAARPAALSRARRALLELIEQEGPATLATLAAASGLHENTVRGHLEGLAADGLVVRERGPAHGRGRPAWLWRACSDSAVREYAGLAAALARTLRRTSERPEDDAVGAGQDWGHGLAAGRAGREGTPSSQVYDLLRDLGFAPEGQVAEGGADLLLTRCPLLEAASAEPDIVCNVHLGLVVGALQEYDAPDPDAELLPFAEPGGCRLRLRERAG